MDKALDIIIKRLSSSTRIDNVVTKAYTSVRKQAGGFSFWAYEAMIFLLEQLLEKGKLEKPIVFTEGSYQLNVNPSSIRKNRFGIDCLRYDLSFLGRHFSLGEFPVSDITNKVMRANINVKVGRRLLIERSLDGIIDDVYEPKIDGFVDSKELLANKFNLFSGVCVKKTLKNGDLRIGGKRFCYGLENANKYLLVFFDRGSIFSFDKDGNHLEQKHLDGCRLLKRRKKQKIISIAGLYNFIDRERNRRFAEDYLIELWKESPDVLLPSGRRIILLEGKFVSNTGNYGRVNLFYLNERKKDYLMVAGNLPPTDVLVDWRGPYLLIKREKDEVILNSFQFQNYGLEVIKHRYMSELKESMVLVNLNPEKSEIWFGTNKRLYSFSKSQIKSHLAQFSDYDSVAIFAHVYFDETPGCTINDRFYLAVSHEGICDKLPLECRRTKELKK
ncbi:hypothetical protein HY636_03900 [Candidatus Woesearchaeota archaeon]|nr:hypothetical protein [Candidatus Woesearchaeota archaeon]